MSQNLTEHGARAEAVASVAIGVFKAIKTTPLLTWEEGVKAMKKAKKVLYQLPSDDSVFFDRVG